MVSEVSNGLELLRKGARGRRTGAGGVSVQELKKIALPAALAEYGHCLFRCRITGIRIIGAQRPLLSVATA